MMTAQADPRRMGYVGRVPGARDSNAWFTPVEYVDAVRVVLGVIDLDPFSSDDANKIVKAGRYFTERDNAFTADWSGTGTAFMNPPYGRGICGKAICKFAEEYRKGSFKEGIVLTNASTDTSWFSELAKISSSLCFTFGRIKFWNSDGKAKSSNTRGQVFFYAGCRRSRFEAEFKQFGNIFRGGV